MRQSRPRQPPVVATSASFSVARLVMSPIFLSASRRERAEVPETAYTVTGERNATHHTGYYNQTSSLLTRTPNVSTGSNVSEVRGSGDLLPRAVGRGGRNERRLSRGVSHSKRPCPLQHREPPSFVSSTRPSMACVPVMAPGSLTITITATTQSRLQIA